MTPDQLALKRATAETIKGVGGLEAAAGFCRVKKSTLSDNQSQNHGESFVAIDVVAALEPLARERSGWPAITHALCAANGGAFVALPEAPVSAGGLLDAMSDLSGEFNDATRAVCHGLADGKWCAADSDQLERELDGVIRVAVRMRALARQCRGETR